MVKVSRTQVTFAEEATKLGVMKVWIAYIEWPVIWRVSINVLFSMSYPISIGNYFKYN